MNHSTNVAMLVGLVASASVATAQTWNEVGDAGQSIAGAQATVGPGDLQFINGSLSDRNDVDLFCIRITDEAQFRAEVTSFVGMDSVLWLFNPDGTLQVFNDDFTGALSTITSQGVFANGVYFLGISRFANSPVNAANADLATVDFWPGPDGAQFQGNTNILDNWNNDTSPSVQGGAYSITLRGAEFHVVPAPGAAAVLGLGSVLVAGRRRRR